MNNTIIADRLGPLLFLAGIALFGDTTSLVQKIPCRFSVVGAREEVRSWSYQPRLSFLVVARMEQIRFRASCSSTSQIIKSRSSGRPKLPDSVSRNNCGFSICGKFLVQKIPCGFSVVGAREEVRSWSCQPRLSFLVAARMEQVRFRGLIWAASFWSMWVCLTSGESICLCWWILMTSAASCSSTSQIIKSRSSGRPKLPDSVSRNNCGFSICGKL
ncbi:hypothetical protein DY000_02024929 [Brassica cretica]|uniref:Secreted protein n=1 Tax=Brassica cretica TaxID=69181 RepID=A0ABQ7EKZ2_BRACR|nr:hypothetical protein DY000_02024929 [Brassica cretica]